MAHTGFITLLPLLTLLALTDCAFTSAEPYHPTDETQILERLRLNPADPVARETRALRAQLAKEPDNLALAVHLATSYIERSRTDGDPRRLGQAQALLSPWWHRPTPPPAVLFVRALINQHVHNFDAALMDLDQVLMAQPAHAQAWLTKATILHVQARYDEARHACQPLARAAARHVSRACLSEIAGLTGLTAASQSVLRDLLDHGPLSDRERLWILTILAEQAARAGQAALAEQAFTEARSLGVPDQYLLTAYADFLLDQGRAREVLPLLQPETRADGALLRLALAEQALGLAAATEHAALLTARFSASRARGATAHAREEARFSLTLLHNPRQALQLARDNWAVQREPADARILLESALAAGSSDAAQPVIEWLASSRIEDLRLRQLAHQLHTSRP